MPITTSCPRCQALFRLPDPLAGKQVRCQKCAQIFLVPPSALTLNAAAPVLSDPATTGSAPMPQVEAPSEASTAEAPMTEVPMAEVPGVPTASAPVQEPVIEALLAQTDPASEALALPLATPVAAALPRAKPVRVPEGSISTGWALASLAFFYLVLSGTGVLASLWVSRHLLPPLPMQTTGVDPLREKPDPMIFDQRERDFVVNDPRQRLQTILVLLDANGYMDQRRFLPQDPSAPNMQDPLRFKVYLVALQAGKRYEIAMHSKAFATHLKVYNPEGGLVREAHSIDGDVRLEYAPLWDGMVGIHAIGGRPADGQPAAKEDYTLTIRPL